MITRRRVLLAVLALFLVGAGTIAGTLARMPPVKYYLRHGFDPYCEPTGETVTYEGVEIGPGIFRVGSTANVQGGDWLGRICAPLGLPWGTCPYPSNEMPVHWVEFCNGFWIAATEITNAQYECFKPKNRRSEYSKINDAPVVMGMRETTVRGSRRRRGAADPVVHSSDTRIWYSLISAREIIHAQEHILHPR